MPGLPAWESGPGPADPAISAGIGYTYQGSGYGPVGQGAIGAGEIGTSTPGPQAAQVRLYVGQDGNLYALENITGLTFKVGQGGSVQPPNYSPTRGL